MSEIYSVVFGLVFWVAIISIIIAGVKSSKKRKLNIERQRKDLESRGVKHSGMFRHMTGLPVAEGSVCNVLLYEDKITFEYGGASFSLDKSKITDVCIKSDIDIQKHYSSSAGGAVAGALVFGPLGAIIGGRTKKKETKTISHYLIYTYLKNDSLDYISFNASNSLNIAGHFIKDFKQSTQTAVVFEL